MVFGPFAAKDKALLFRQMLSLAPQLWFKRDMGIGLPNLLFGSPACGSVLAVAHSLGFDSVKGSLPLDGGDAQVFVQLIRQFHIPFLVAGIPVGGVVASFTPFDADKLSGGPQGGEAQFRQPLGHLGGKPFLFGLDAPIIRLPQMDIQLAAVHLDGALLEAFAPSRQRLVHPGTLLRW